MGTMMTGMESCTSAEKTKAGISVQLYTIRDAIAKDAPGSLKRLYDMGFRNVETAFWPDGTDLQQAAGWIRNAGLKVSSCHVELPVGDQKQKMLELANVYGAKRMIWHGWPEDKRYSSLEGTKELAGIYNESFQFAADHGLEFGLHNHWWEFRNKVGGKYVYEILLEETDPRIFFEIDTYWVKVAGHEPSKTIDAFGNRVKLLHIKDGPAKWNDELAIDNPDPMTAVGKGTQDIPAILKASEKHVEWLVVEMDKTSTDVFQSLDESLQYLIGIH